MVVRKINKKIEDIYPLSPMQQGMLYHSLYGAESGLYSELYRFTINGPLNIDHFRAMWDHLIEMHPVLRTIFRWRKLDSPVQVVLKERRPAFDIKDLRAIAEEDQKRELDTFCQKIRTTPFDLEKGPLMRVNLFLLGDGKVHVVWNFHHILMDGWSFPILIRDLLDTYIDLELGQDLSLSQTRPYKDYIRWLNKQDRESAMSFWKKQLGDFSEPTHLPVDYYPAKREGFDIGKKVLDLSHGLTSRLSALARDERVTLSSLMNTAWAILLSRYSNEDDIVFGYTVSGRPPDLEGSEDMVGLFINTLPLRAKIDEARGFLALLKDIHEKALEIRDYEYSLLPDIKGCSPIKGGQSLFDSIVVFENYPSESISIEGDFSISDFTVTEITNFDLTVLISPGKQMNICIEYARDLFKDSTIERMISHFQNLLENIAARPNAQVCDLTMLSKDEMNQVLMEFNDTDSDFPKDKSPYQLFEEQVRKTPEQTAVAFEDNSLTYKELNEKANQLAHYLRKKGVGKKAMVGLMLERSLDMIIGILGIQKAGGAYIPMDPEYPRPRLEYMLEDTKAPVLVTQSALLDRLSKRPPDTVVLDKDWDKIGLESSDNPLPLSTPGNLSHIIYTSGSTGIPKGVMIEHRNVTAFLYWCKDEFSFDEYEKMIASTSICFDLSV
ncbi:MAG: condensation domain-containing protein, partial [Thermodesulfobacteriota bacterium]|nr:condensation domain-containing protein [Thermodesulfobacteriota bacterium]